MEVRGKRTAAVAEQTEPIAGLDAISDLDRDTAGLQVRVDGAQTTPHLHHDVVAGKLIERKGGGLDERDLVSLTVARSGDDAAGDGFHGCAVAEPVREPGWISAIDPTVVGDLDPIDRVSLGGLKLAI